MYPGWMMIGGETLDGEFFEIINNQRVFSYADTYGICWLERHTECTNTAYLTPGGPDFHDPASDKAPWYDPLNPDTAGFLGVVGIDVTGSDSSTRTATVTPTLGDGGVIGPLYFGPRTMVIRALAVARDACSLQSGLNWLRCQYQSTTDACTGDTMTFFDCCPCDCPDQQEPGETCWVSTYAELLAGPSLCAPDFWPVTYAQLYNGFVTSEDWCTWLHTYGELATTGPPAWGCCVEPCVVPYLRQFRHVRIIEGPTVLSSWPEMHSGGAFAEIEFTVVAADPNEYTLLTQSLAAVSDGGGTPLTDPTPPAPPTPGSDPFGLLPVIRRADLIPPAIVPPLAPQAWERDAYLIPEPDDRARLGESVHSIDVLAVALTERFRIGIWTATIAGAADEFVGGWYMPFLPAGDKITIDAMNLIVTTPDATAPGGVRRIDAFLRDFDGTALKWIRAPQGDLVVTVDRHPTDIVSVSIAVRSASIGCA